MPCRRAQPSSTASGTTPFNNLGQLRSATTVEQALERAKADIALGRRVIAVLYAFPYMSYYYGGMYVVIRGWGHLQYQDPEIDGLLRSPFVRTLREHRNASFHFSPEYFDSRMQAFVNEPESEIWLSDLHAALVRWFSYHLKLKPGEGISG